MNESTSPSKHINHDYFILNDIEKNILYDSPDQVIFLRELYKLVNQFHQQYERYKKELSNQTLTQSKIENEKVITPIEDIAKNINDLNEKIFNLLMNFLKWYQPHLPNFISLIIIWKEVSKNKDFQNNVSFPFLHSYLYLYEKIGIQDLLKENLLSFNTTVYQPM